MTIVAGPAGAPAIVFVHGTRLTGAMWSAQQAALADEFRTIAVDLPAHGSRAAEPFTLDAATAAVDDAIATEAAGRAIVVGLSLGGYVAMALAAREPARVRGLVAVGRHRRTGRDPDAAVPRPGRRHGRHRPGRPDAAQRADLPASLPGGHRRADRRRRVLDARRGGGAPGPRGRAVPAAPGELPGPDADHQRVASTSRSGSSPRRSRAAAHDVRRVRLAGAGHNSNLDRPAAFTAAVRRFARSLDAT